MERDTYCGNDGNVYLKYKRYSILPLLHSERESRSKFDKRLTIRSRENDIKLKI